MRLSPPTNFNHWIDLNLPRCNFGFCLLITHTKFTCYDNSTNTHDHKNTRSQKKTTWLIELYHKLIHVRSHLILDCFSSKQNVEIFSFKINLSDVSPFDTIEVWTALEIFFYSVCFFFLVNCDARFIHNTKSQSIVAVLIHTHKSNELKWQWIHSVRPI